MPDYPCEWFLYMRKPHVTWYDLRFHTVGTIPVYIPKPHEVACVVVLFQVELSYHMTPIFYLHVFSL